MLDWIVCYDFYVSDRDRNTFNGAVRIFGDFYDTLHKIGNELKVLKKS